MSGLNSVGRLFGDHPIERERDSHELVPRQLGKLRRIDLGHERDIDIFERRQAQHFAAREQREPARQSCMLMTSSASSTLYCLVLERLSVPSGIFCQSRLSLCGGEPFQHGEPRLLLEIKVNQFGCCGRGAQSAKPRLARQVQCRRLGWLLNRRGG